MRAQAFYLSVDDSALGQRFCILHCRGDAEPHGLVVYAMPLAEEMNKSRRMVALQSRALAASGFAVLQIDLLGCGDSAGDFGDATWSRWVEDIVFASTWLRAEQGKRWPRAAAAPMWLWGLRAGCLLATAAAARLATPCNLLFWNPVINGKTMLQQMLRLATVGAALGKGDTGTAASLREALSAGSAVDIAGYRLNPELASGLEAAVLVPQTSGGRVEWLDVAPQPRPQIPPATQQALSSWDAAGHAVRHTAVIGPAFWQTAEIEDAPAMLAATLSMLASPITRIAAHASTAHPALSGESA